MYEKIAENSQKSIKRREENFIWEEKY